MTDNKGAVNLTDKSSVKLGDGKTPAKFLDDRNNFPKVGETKKSGYNKAPVRLSGTKERHAKTGSGNLTRSACEIGPAKLSDQAQAKLKVIPPIINPSSVPDSIPKSNIPMKSESDIFPTNTGKNPPTIPVSESNPPAMLNDPISKILDLGNASQKVAANKEHTENKPKDSFDLLLQSSNTNYNPPKISDVKDVFNFSFGSASTAKDPPVPFPKYPSSSPDSLCRMTSKSSSSETVDVSKMIPGILERLKKDVVSDSKASDSPPPPKEELSFDFLRGQASSKSLSRSDSSNSLRICESDTNDSNGELKVTPAKFNRLENLSDSSAKLPEAKAELQNVQKTVSEANLSSSSSNNAFTTNIHKVNTPVISQPASVITTTSSSAGKESLPILDKNNTLSPKEESKLPAAFVQANPLTGDTESKDDKKSVLSTSPFALESSSVVGSAVKKESIAPLDGSQPSETKSESKESSLFDKIKASFDEIKPEAKSEQSSVIKFVSEPSTTASPGSILPAETAVKKEDSKPFKEEEKQLESKEKGEVKDISAEDSSALKNTSTDTASAVPEKESSAEASTTREDSPFTKKDMKKKKLGKKSGKKFPEALEKEGKDKDPKVKETKLKAKKRLKPENYDSDKSKSLDLKAKSKKIKKNKKRFARHDDSFGENMKKFDFRDEDHRTDKLKKSHRKKKFLKSGIKIEESPELKKKKSKKNRDKMAGDKTRNMYEPGKKDFKTKKKRKLQPEDDTDSEKESSVSKLKRKKKKFKVSSKDCSSSDEADEEFFKDKASSSYMRQDSSKSDNDPDMSFLLCEEKVDDSSGTSSNEEDLGMDLLPGYPSCSRGRESPNKHSVLDNTPPTTPSSTESLLSSSPSQHDRDLHYPESTQSCEGDPLFHARASEEYRAATTLAFAVCKSVEESQVTGDKGSPSKRKKKRTQRYSSEVAKSPKHKSSFPRVSKVDNYCEDSSGTSPATSSSPTYGNPSALSFSRSLPHRLSGTSEGSSRYFYVPLHEKDPEKRISVLQDKMAALRKKYMALRAEVMAIDHKRRKARKKVRESGGGAANPSAHSEDGHSGS